MADLKLPLHITQHVLYPGTWSIIDGKGETVAGANSLRRAEVIVAALEADAELGAPICECCTKKGTEPYWHQECDCMNQGDLADAAGWCALANMLGRKSEKEKEERGG